ncbi:flagellar export protein FliJ [Ornithinibacillus scapharcae]|uniref:flagellar export protein FliJ n=1 Tax=Ornithinibacillus scapharcae TaxID=1147159 RepID=UPI000225AA3F|nr:flagellar export protein FliJ [Ornithinibacillus scapharcae]
MSGTAVLTKILDIREREKRDAELAYKRSVDLFEEVGTKLLRILQKKEAVEASYEESLRSNMNLDQIQDQLAYIESLNKHIEDLQLQVQKARYNMESKQQVLTEAHVETKKFEKIIDIRATEEQEVLKRAEATFMDDISIQQYLSHKK